MQLAQKTKTFLLNCAIWQKQIAPMEQRLPKKYSSKYTNMQNPLDKYLKEYYNGATDVHERVHNEKEKRNADYLSEVSGVQACLAGHPSGHAGSGRRDPPGLV